MKIGTTIKLFSIGVAGAWIVGSAQHVSAKQYAQNFHGRQVVVHTNAIPVILHRMVPPQYGRHVTVREIQAGKLPSGRVR